VPIDHFNLIAGLYDRVGQFHATEPLLGVLSLSPGNLLIDVGGGTGRVAKALLRMVRGVLIVDTSKGMLRRAADKGLATVCAPAEFLPLPSGIIDRIIMMDAFHHVIDQRQTARELWRVLAPGGRILIVEPDIHKFSIKLLAIGEKLLLMRSHFLDSEEVSSLFTDPDAKISVLLNELNFFLVAEKPV
jgi:ubiquinone/menaquinone biosynthesis C-methylase UbiE